MSLVSLANQLVATSSVTKRHGVEQPIGTCALVLIGRKVFITVSIQSQGEVNKSTVLLDHLIYNKLKGYYGILDNAKEEMPALTLKVLLAWLAPAMYRSCKHRR